MHRHVTSDQPATLSPLHLAELRHARLLLENPGLAPKMAALLGRPIEKGIEMLPPGWSERIGEATREALSIALRGAIGTMDLRQGATAAAPRWHKVAAAFSGAAGGAFGLPALLVELPVSTTIMCRSIADIARAGGESLDDPATRLACLEVFALGGVSRADDAGETGYFAVRAALAKAVSSAAEYLATHKLAQEAAPPLVRLVGIVAARFQVQVTEKALGQAIPIIGAAAGALINLMFIDHFQAMSRGHFTVRRLERIYGPQAVQREYARL